MKKYLLLLITSIFLFTACSEDEDQPAPQNLPPTPEFYEFERNGTSTVSFSGQTARILMAEELISEMKNFQSGEEILLEMYRNSGPNGEDVNPFENPDLNQETKSIREKVANSVDLFSANTSESAQIKNDFENWMSSQVLEVFPNENNIASPGTPGQLADGSSTRYVNALGLEYDQMVNKGLIGALMFDQAINHYLSADYLDRNNNRENNINGISLDGAAYTEMEHFWDEAYGYFYGTAADPANPNATIGQDDSFLNKYIGRMEGDPDFAGTAERLFSAFKLGRAAIVAGDYDLRDDQVKIIRYESNNIIAVRSVYYLQQAKLTFPLDRNNYNAYGPALHDLSEGYGFIYSLRFTKNPETGEAYFSRTEVDSIISKLLGDGPNGLWDVKPETLDELSSTIASKFDFSVSQAAE